MRIRQDDQLAGVLVSRRYGHPMPETPTKHEVLTALTFGARVAEDEREELADYFVETDQWERVFSGRVDVIFGAKGAGKSAIYTSLMDRAASFASSRILLTTAEKPRGNTVFQGLVANPPTSEIEFVAIWKLYFLTLIGSTIVDKDMFGDDAQTVKDALFREGLLAGSDAPLASRFRMVWDWIRQTVARVAPQAELRVDPATQAPTVSFKISLEEPSVPERHDGVVSIDDLLSTANQALALNDSQVWILIDRLDVAFSESRELEANGIRALFKAYLDMNELDQISPKIFLRTDIWNEISAGGFREASHITKQLRIEWSSSSLLNLIVRRAVRAPHLTSYYSTSAANVLSSAWSQRSLFDGMVPEKVDVGRNPLTFEWILGRAQDGTKKPAPREVIHLLNEARDAQVRMVERGEQDPPGVELLSRAALREALSPVSSVRLEQTIYAEYPSEKPWIEALEGERTEQTTRTLATAWGVDEETARFRAQRLVDIGFLEARTAHGTPTYWVPFLYRPALGMRQGAA